jgi:hypothetical protein
MSSSKPTPDDDSSTLHIELPKRVPPVTTTAEKLNERAKTIKINLEAQEVQSDMILQQK